MGLTDVSSQNLAGIATYRRRFLRAHVSVSGSWLSSCDKDAPGAGVGIDCTLVPSIPAGWAAHKGLRPTVSDPLHHLVTLAVRPDFDPEFGILECSDQAARLFSLVDLHNRLVL